MDVNTILATVKDAVSTMDPAKPSDVAAAAKRNGLEVVDNDTIASLRRDAAEGRQLKANAERDKVDVLASVPNETAVPIKVGYGVGAEQAGELADEWF